MKPIKDYKLDEPIESGSTIIPQLTKGIKIATIVEDGGQKDLFAPEGSSENKKHEISFEVYATNEDIPAGTIDEDTGLEYKVDIPACMSESLGIYVPCKKSDCDVVIDWGDGKQSVVATDPTAIPKRPTYQYSPDTGLIINAYSTPNNNFTAYREDGSSLAGEALRYNALDITQYEYNEDETSITKVHFNGEHGIKYKPGASSVPEYFLEPGTPYTITLKQPAVKKCYSRLQFEKDGVVTTILTQLERAGTQIDVDSLDGLIYHDDTTDSWNVEDKKWNNIQYMHRYENPGKYIVTVTGNLITGFRSSLHYGAVVEDKFKYNIISRLFDYDLKWDTHIQNISSGCSGSLRLQKVVIPTYWRDNINNSCILFNNCKNLLYFKGHTQTPFLVHPQVSLNTMFNGCSNLITIQGLELPSSTGRSDGNTFQDMYNGCSSLTTNIYNLLPANGFFGKTVNVKNMFTNCANVDVSYDETKPAEVEAASVKLGKYLWNDNSIEWLNTTETFIGCSDKLRKIVPTTWGGTKA